MAKDGWINVNPHDCSELAGVLKKLRASGVPVATPPAIVGELLRLGEEVLNDDALWAAAPAMMGGEPKADLRGVIRAIVDKSKT